MKSAMMSKVSLQAILKENKVLMKNWLEEKYWICPLYTAEELKELGTKWKNQAE